MTQEYIGTKIVTAWEAPKDDKPGYNVKYADGYISWSPKDVFEAAYLPLGHISQLPPHQQRVIGEHAEVNDRAKKLAAFLATDTYAGLPYAERMLLQEQLFYMEKYEDVLFRRVSHF